VAAVDTGPRSLTTAFCILGALPVTLESPLPESLPPSGSLALYCSGVASDGELPVRSFAFTVDGALHPPTAFAMPRPDMPCARSGFWGVVPVVVGARAREVVLGAEVGLQDGPEAVELARIPVRAADAHESAPPSPDLIAICMATFNPDIELLERQLDSIRAQTDTHWRCVISDDHSEPARLEAMCELLAGDDRFSVSAAGERIGFYRNFERALSLAPAEAPLIALCDQDDFWHPDKLAVLRGALGDAMLVYSDQRLVDEHGGLIRPSLWRGRANNWTNLGSMLIANTVTGAASLFRREVAELARPFPDSPGIEFHDHWIALTALSAGRLAYVARPLYDYVQHEGAVLGKIASGRGARRWRPARSTLDAWRAAYFLGYVPGQVRAATLLLRCADRLEPGKRRALERYMSAERSLLGLAWLALRPLRALRGRTETLATEWELVRGVLWRRIAPRLGLDTRFPDPPHFEQRRLQRWRART
jgi:glycosyltransferase involved in cell wall biosynthesis